MGADMTGADPAAAPDPLGVTAELLVETLGVRVQTDGAQPPTYRFRLGVRFAEGLQRRGVLDLAARCFRTTLWAGEHRCLDHLELADVVAVACDTVAGRLTLESTAVRLVLNRHGALSVVPAAHPHLRHRRPTVTGGGLAEPS